ncbi:Toll/interleukin-1 receptor homology (TIR) domain superfamily, partial [Arabidopsis thaliana x Arabidopsis arenosa]
ASSSSSSRNWSYHVFPSFSGEDVRNTFLSHFLKELDRKLIISFKDNEIERSQSLDPELKHGIRNSRIAVVVFSKTYASSSWCLNELLEIVKCKKEFGQLVIPIFYNLDPSHVRKQTGDFGKIFEKTCRCKTVDEKIRWKEALTDVANILGYHIVTWDNEASMIEEIANDILGKMNISPSNDFEDLVGIEDHITKMSSLLHLESEEVRMVGIWGPSGIGKTTIARALFSRLSCQFQSSVFIDKVFISKSMEVYSGANLVDYNMKLHLQRAFLAEIFDKKDIKIHVGAMEKMVKHRKALIVIDDLDDQDVLDALAGQTQWFGSGSRIIVVTENKHFLRANRIDHIYKVCLPSNALALEMFCRSAFKKNSPPDDFLELSSEVALRAGNLPLGLNVLGSNLRGINKGYWIDMLPRLQGLDGKIGKTLRVSYDGLNNRKDEAIFRHIACIFNGEKVSDIKLLLANSNLDVNIGLKNLVDRSLICERFNTLEMHSLLQELGKEIVRTQSNQPGEREFLVDLKDICDVLEHNTGTKKVLGITLDIDETDELHIHESSFKGMHNLLFLKVYTKKLDQKKKVRWHLPERFDYLPSRLRLLRFDRYPSKCLPSNFHPENLVKLQMQQSKLEKLWDGVHSLAGLRNMDLRGSRNLKEIPDLSMATNLETLKLSSCSSLVELPSSIQYLNKLNDLDMSYCDHLETIPSGVNLKSLDRLNLSGCSRLKSFLDIPTNISWLDIGQTADIPSNLRLQNLDELILCERVQLRTPLMTMLSPTLTRLTFSNNPSFVEVPSSIQNLYQLEHLEIMNCRNLVTLPTGINLDSLISLDLSHCSQLKTFPDISTNISDLNLSYTAIEEVPLSIEKLSLLCYLDMNGCSNLLCVSPNISKLKHLERADFSDCVELTEASWNGSSSEMVKLLPADNFSTVKLNFNNCFKLDLTALIQNQTFFMQLILTGEEVPSYFTHRTSGDSISLPHISLCQSFFSFRGCTVIDVDSFSTISVSFDIEVCCRFIDRFGNHFDSTDFPGYFITTKLGGHLVVFDCYFPFNEEFTTFLDGQFNYDQVDIQFRLTNDNSQLKLKGCGILLSEDVPSLDNRPCSPNILPGVCEDSALERRSFRTKMRMMRMRLLKKLLNR